MSLSRLADTLIRFLEQFREKEPAPAQPVTRERPVELTKGSRRIRFRWDSAPDPTPLREQLQKVTSVRLGILIDQNAPDWNTEVYFTRPRLAPSLEDIHMIKKALLDLGIHPEIWINNQPLEAYLVKLEDFLDQTA